MDVTADELAGVVDLFGGLTRAELERALSEAAFRADGGTVDGDALAAAIDEAIEAFALVRYDRDAREPLLAAGPAAFPRVPDGAEDVPHILDVERRRLDREALGEAVRDRFAAAVEAALEGAGGTGGSGGQEPAESGNVDRERVRRLLEVSYDLEAWAPVDVAPERERLEAALEDG